MATNETIGRMLALFHELYPTRDISPATGEAWAVVFRDIADERVQWAARAVVREEGREFFPTPGEVMARLPPANYIPKITAGTDAVDTWYAEQTRKSKRIPSPLQ